MGRGRFLFLPFPCPVGPPFRILTYPIGRVGVIHPSAWKENSPKFAKITHLGYALGPSSVIQSVHSQAGRPLIPLRGTATRLSYSCRASLMPQGVTYVRE
jgi:hypothetical protein